MNGAKRGRSALVILAASGLSLACGSEGGPSPAATNASNATAADASSSARTPANGSAPASSSASSAAPASTASGATAAAPTPDAGASSDAGSTARHDAGDAGGSTTSSASPSSAGSTAGSTSAAAQGPCDIYNSDPSGTVHCVAAHSTVRALFSGYAGALYQVRNAAGATHDVSVVHPGGVADSSAQDTFCSGTACVITVVYDQSGHGNDLHYQGSGSPVGGKDQPSSATAESINVGGNKEYSLYIKLGNSYWVNGAASGVPTGSAPEGMYMVTSGTHFNGGCCFDYGNSETDRKADGAGAMDAINFSAITMWGTGQGSGPWVMADLEYGLFSQGGGGRNANDPSQTARFVTAMLKNNGTTEFALRGADATSGSLSTYYKGALPPGWSPMKKQGAIVLGSGGDCCATDTNLSEGTFYEGCLVAGYPADATEQAVQANIVAAKYSK